MIKPLGDRVILKEKDMTVKSAIILTPKVKETEYGEVVEIPLASTGNQREGVSIGDIVVYDINDFHEVDYKQQKYLIVKYDNLLARADSD